MPGPRINVGPCKLGCGRPSRKVGYCETCYITACRTGAHVPHSRKVVLPAFTPNREELAWSAGFFDGEGTFMIGSSTVPSVQVSQCGDHAVELLSRFRDALGIAGRIESKGPRKPPYLPAFAFRASGFERTQVAVARLWPWLGPAKRAQAARTLARYHEIWVPPPTGRITTAQVVQRYGISKSRLARWRDCGRVSPAVRYGHEAWWTIDEIEAMALAIGVKE